MPFKFLKKTPSANQIAAAERAAERSRAGSTERDPAAQRAPERPHDRELMKHAVAWADGLPARDRPARLLESYPRVANRIALCWNDASLTNRLFDELLTDQRGGRKGFPSPVRDELVRLRVDYPKIPKAPKTDPPASPWDIDQQAMSDRR